MTDAKDGEGSQSDGNYEVGFGKPPKHTRWKKGQSGNPKGRRKGNRNMATQVSEMLEQRVVVRQNGVERQLSYGEALLTRIASQGLTGSSKDSLAVMKMIKDYLPEALIEEPSPPVPRNITVRFVESDGNGRPAPGQGLLPGEDPAQVKWREVCPADRSFMSEPQKETASSDSAASGESPVVAPRADEVGSEEGLSSRGDSGAADDDSWLD